MIEDRTAAKLIKAAQDAQYKQTQKARGRGYASDKEAWADIKIQIESLVKTAANAKKLHVSIWTAIAEESGDEVYVTMQELERAALQLAGTSITIATMASLAMDE